MVRAASEMTVNRSDAVKLGSFGLITGFYLPLRHQSPIRSMTLSMFKAKIHRATVTQAELYYEGSVTVDQGLLDLAGILPYEKVHIVNVNNGARLETYTIPAKAGSGTICLNGPAARLAATGDEVILISYAQMTPEEARAHEATVVLVDDKNRPKEILKQSVADPEIHSA